MLKDGHFEAQESKGLFIDQAVSVILQYTCFTFIFLSLYTLFFPPNINHLNSPHHLHSFLSFFVSLLCQRAFKAKLLELLSHKH